MSYYFTFHFHRHIQKYRETHLLWALKTGTQARFLLNIYFEKQWETPIADLRKEMNIELPPPTPKLLKKKDATVGKEGSERGMEGKEGS